MVVEQASETLAVFATDSDDASRKLLARIQEIDAVDDNVQIIDAAIVDRTRLGRVKVHQTKDYGTLKGGVRGGAIGVVVGALIAGPVGAVAGGAAVGMLGGLRGRFHDIGIDDKFMREVGKEIEKHSSALFVQYTGDWSKSIALIEAIIKEENAKLISSTLPPATAAALVALVEPVAEDMGGDEVVSDYELETEETEADAAAAEEAPPVAAAAAVAAPEPVATDDLTQLAGIGPKATAALATAGITTYAALAEANEPQLRHALHQADMVPPGNVASWPMQASYAAKGDWQGLMKYNQRSAPKPKAAPRAADAPPPDDLTQLSGIGPRISSILSDGGITTYAQLQHADTGQLREIIAAGGALPPSSLDTWPTQASYAARGDWSGLAAYNRH